MRAAVGVAAIVMLAMALVFSGPGAVSNVALAQGAAAGGQAAGGGRGGGRGVLTDDTTAARIERSRAPLAQFRPVTNAQLLNPAPADWLHWRRTYDGYGFSPLAQINRATARNLRVAWTWPLPAGVNEAAPLVRSGILYMFGAGDRVFALSAATGDLLWQYERTLPRDLEIGGNFFTKKNLAIHGSKIIVATSDLHLLALDAVSGKVLWDHEVDDYRRKYSYTGGPLVVRDKVLMGSTNCGQAQAGGCFISAHDVETGKEAWRFYTVAKPGDVGGNSWNNLPLDRRFGGSVWTSGSYDPELNLTYWGTGQAYPWSADQRGTSEPQGGAETTRDLLFTNSTLALDPDTGKLVWYYSHLPNDSWDQDYAFERLIVTVQVNGRPRKAVVTAGKLGIIEGLDAATGEFLFARDLGVQTIVTAIDPKTGAKTIDPAVIPKIGTTTIHCPHVGGARDWQPGAYNPTTKVYYLTVTDNCTSYTPQAYPEGYRGGNGAAAVLRAHPSTPDGQLARIDATNLDTRQPVWQYRERAPQTSPVLTTAGGILFAGSLDRYFRAFDDRTGAILWQIRVNDVPNAPPITYAVNGKQFIAVSVGTPGFNGRTFAALTPDIRVPAPSNVLWVFELP